MSLLRGGGGLMGGSKFDFDNKKTTFLEKHFKLQKVKNESRRTKNSIINRNQLIFSLKTSPLYVCGISTPN